MCGIIAILRRRSTSPAPDLEQLEAELRQSLGDIDGEVSDPSLAHRLERVAVRLAKADRQLATAAGVRALVLDRDAERSLREIVGELRDRVEALEAALDRAPVDSRGVESLNAGLVSLRDVVFSLERDRLDGARAVRELARGHEHEAAVTALFSIHQTLRALDRLEVRGRDSAGLVVVLRNLELDAESAPVSEQLASRADPLLGHRAVRLLPAAGEGQGTLTLAYKRAAEIGELGDNVRFLREAIRDDDLLHLALAGARIEATVIGHTRWASVGMISEANAHPLDERTSVEPLGNGASVIAVLNGDVDNYADLKAAAGLRFPEAITTDAKVIPALVSTRVARGVEPVDAFRETVAAFEGSVAIVALDLARPDRLWLATAGSGQGLYVGLSPDDLSPDHEASAEGVFMVASEPYGLVEQTRRYLRLDGTRGGQVVVLDGDAAGRLTGIERRGYDGSELPVAESELVVADLTTRDIDRGDAPHYLRKEIAEAPRSFAKTLRGKIVGPEGAKRVELTEETIPPDIASRLENGSFRRILVIGQGTAAVAGAGVAEALERALALEPLAPSVTSLCATELSGFQLRDDMSDCLVVAVSQSGTTTDTNRTVDLARSRGAAVLAIVNRRHSDLVSKADGVLYTSDGRDVEMSVASTKAFYSQIAAGVLLASAIADRVHGGPSGGAARQALLAALARLPEAMRRVIDERSAEIARVAEQLAPPRRYWALVGNGPNRIAAREVRIKLSELCYKSIACDATEDKKHIDLSSEPLILVCAAGLVGSTADDVAKEVAIYRAHKATPVVICSEGESRFAAAVERIEVPRVHPALDFVLSAVVGHLFGYFAAQAIDTQARPLRRIRGAIESAVQRWPSGDGTVEPLALLASEIAEPARAFSRGLAERRYDGHLEASTALPLWRLLHVLDRPDALDTYAREWGRPASPGPFLEDLAAAATRAIDELTRPIDAIKHQAKTVTVGISRSDEALFSVPLVKALLETGIDRAVLSYADLRTMARLDPAVDRVLGFTRYRIDGDPREEGALVRVVDSGGVARDLRSRTHDNPALKGTKRRVAVEGRVLVARGQSDGRTFALVPEIEGGKTRGLTLIHVELAEQVAAGILREVLSGYRDRYSELRDLVMETESGFPDELLTTLPVADVLTAPPEEVVRRWRSSGDGEAGSELGRSDRAPAAGGRAAAKGARRTS
ncbi:MAG TPA: SIS domain-containing protein [Thermoanaerobaculia bacterium]|nr:SIS domain-containing protein [Thermoanaerobaculia bacterium]